MAARHGGDIRRLAEASGLRPEEILDFSANINPLGPPEWLRSVISWGVGSLVHYPDRDCKALVQAVAQRYAVKEEEVMAGNGSSEILHVLSQALKARRAVIPFPTYSGYEKAAESSGAAVTRIRLKEESGFVLDPSEIGALLEGGEIVYLCRPNNPTGLTCAAEGIREVAETNPDTFFLVDEAFIDFVEGAESLTRERPPNVVVSLSFTKLFAVPGLRLGAAVGDPEVVARAKSLQPCWSVNSIAQAVGAAALRDAAYAGRSKRYVTEARKDLIRDLETIPGLRVWPGEANFLLVKIADGAFDAHEVAQRMLARGVAVRTFDRSEGLGPRFFRVAVRRKEENARLVHALRLAMGLRSPFVLRRKTPAVMFQGVCSNAGKSILTAALCRILLQDGYKPAPFKAQNMSLNSYVTRTGGEMGRAQVVQAQACRLDPDVRMNPILLKPNTDTGSQVIVNGRPIGNMRVKEYISYKAEGAEAVRKAYDSLASEFDVMVIEGAGSPAEVNLKRHDIVNMRMARYAEASVLLVGDIDRGGVFASFIGTAEVLSEWERKLLAGFIINKFRGDETLLDSAMRYTQEWTGRPVLGVVPFIPFLGLPEEDSVSFKRGRLERPDRSDGCVEIAVVDLPHISNFNDIDPLVIEPDVTVKIVQTVEQLGTPDAVIIPGSKNVIGDVERLDGTGLGNRIRELAHKGTEVVGICAGFQIMGREIRDPYRIESPAGKTVKGLEMLPFTNELAKEKTLKQVRGTHLPSGLEVKGYEIHHGVMEGNGHRASVRREDGEIIGISGAADNVWGSYLHGIFDSDPFRRWFIDKLRVRKGLSPLGEVCAVYDLEPAFDRLASIVRESIRMEEIYSFLRRS